MTVAVAHKVSRTGRLALQKAIEEASLRRTDLAVLHVVGSLDADRAEAYRLGISDEIEQVVGKAGDNLTWRLHLRTAASDASVDETLLDLLRQVEAELVVIGARRRSPVGKVFMGSTAQSLILNAPLPVLVIKAG